MSSTVSQIPPIASLTSEVGAVVHYTNLSFVFASSLSVVKRITWEQNPWALPKISAADSEHISRSSEHCLEQPISSEAVQNAVLLGSTYATHEFRKTFGHGLLVYVVFPNLKRDVWKDKKFITTWHDDIVFPAFDTAWKDSGLTPPITRAGIIDKVVPLYHRRADGSLKRVLSQTRNHQGLRRQHWPDFDTEHEKEGKIGNPPANDRWGYFDEAWKSITGMLEGSAELADPLLLLVNKTRLDLHPDHEANKLYEIVGRQWDLHVDSRFIVEGSFRVVLQTVLGEAMPPPSDGEEEGDELRPTQGPVEEGPVEEGAVGVEFKRMAEEESPSMGSTKRLRTQMTHQCATS